MEVVNSTCTLCLPSTLNLQNLAQSSFLAKPKRTRRPRKTDKFKTVVWKNNGVTYLLYANGKCVILGCRSLRDMYEASQWIKEILSMESKELFVLHNVVGTFKIDQEINLRKLSETFKVIRKDYGYFEPELTPALVYHPRCSPKGTCLIFRTGRVIATGVVSFKILNQMYSEIFELIKSF